MWIFENEILHSTELCPYSGAIKSRKSWKFIRKKGNFDLEDWCSDLWSNELIFFEKKYCTELNVVLIRAPLIIEDESEIDLIGKDWLCRRFLQWPFIKYNEFSKRSIQRIIRKSLFGRHQVDESDETSVKVWFMNILRFRFYRKCDIT